MSFADEVREQSRGTGQQCRTCALLAQLPADEAAEIRAVMADPTVQTEPLTRALNNRGIQISGNAVRKHRSRCVIS